MLRTKALSRRGWLSWLTLSAALATGCGGASVTVGGPEQDSSAGSQQIIGGFDATSASLDAVGSVGMMGPDGSYQFFCTATLIGPKTVLTAKHCAVLMHPEYPHLKLVNLLPIYFAVGADTKAPKQVFEAVAADYSPVIEGGAMELGSDVAVYHLAQAVPSTLATPVAVSAAPLTEADLGKKFTSIGYGVQSSWDLFMGDVAGPRRAGPGTLAGLEGKLLPMMFGSLENFLTEMKKAFGAELVNAYKDELTALYDKMELLKGYEAYVASNAGDAQTCFGDSGGPLLGRVKKADGTMERRIFGVTSGGFGSDQQPCAFGTIYATFGQTTQELIAKSTSWADPCANDTVLGSCNGTVARRCTGKGEGDRRVVQFDCAELDQACGQNAMGMAACVDPQTGATAPIEPAPAAPTVAQVRKSVRNGQDLVMKRIRK